MEKEAYSEEMSSRVRVGIVTSVLFLAMLLFGFLRASAAQDQPPGPDRFTVIMQKYTSYEWWLTSWTDNSVACIIDIDHDGLPTGGDILNVCGQDVYDEWVVTNPCPQGGSCEGYYLQFVKSFPAQRKVSVQQPPPIVWVTLDGCVPHLSTFRCDSLPTLVLTGEEPIQGEHITNLGGNIDGKPFTCDPVCQVDLVPTDDNSGPIPAMAIAAKYSRRACG